jgi:Na+-transporting NADH:ubiquinone oxidoreductase subunit NqrC
MHPRKDLSTPEEEILVVHIVLALVVCVVVSAAIAGCGINQMRARAGHEQPESNAAAEIERWTMSRSTMALQRHR